MIFGYSVIKSTPDEFDFECKILTTLKVRLFRTEKELKNGVKLEKERLTKKHGYLPGSIEILEFTTKGKL